MTDKPKRPRDANQLAKFIVDTATQDSPSEIDTSAQREAGKKKVAKREQPSYRPKKS